MAREGNKNAQRHGHKTRVTGATPTYNSWNCMIARCYRESSISYKNYGARGVVVCDAWQGAGGFAQFLSDMGVRPEGKTLDRIDVDGNYEPRNCKWSTRTEQERNKRKKCEPFL